jgi:hypothetical protein
MGTRALWFGIIFNLLFFVGLLSRQWRLERRMSLLRLLSAPPDINLSNLLKELIATKESRIKRLDLWSIPLALTMLLCVLLVATINTIVGSR